MSGAFSTNKRRPKWMSTLHSNCTDGLTTHPNVPLGVFGHDARANLDLVPDPKNALNDGTTRNSCTFFFHFIGSFSFRFGQTLQHKHYSGGIYIYSINFLGSTQIESERGSQHPRACACVHTCEHTQSQVHPVVARKNTILLILYLVHFENNVRYEYYARDSPPLRCSTSSPGLLTSNDRMMISRGTDVKSLTVYIVYSATKKA